MWEWKVHSFIHSIEDRERFIFECNYLHLMKTNLSIGNQSQRQVFNNNNLLSIWEHLHMLRRFFCLDWIEGQHKTVLRGA